MLIPLRPGELQRLIPAVATAGQFRFCLGSPQEILQRVMVATIGGVITFLVYNQAQMGSRWGPFLARHQRRFFPVHPLGTHCSGRAAECHAAPLPLCCLV